VPAWEDALEWARPVERILPFRCVFFLFYFIFDGVLAAHRCPEIVDVNLPVEGVLSQPELIRPFSIRKVISPDSAPKSMSGNLGGWAQAMFFHNQNAKLSIALSVVVRRRRKTCRYRLRWC